MTMPGPTAASGFANNPSAANLTGMITVFGSINIDLVTRVRSLPRPGETVLAEGYATLMGGKGANQAVAAARAAGGLTPVRMIGAVGDDVFGALARGNLAREGVDIAGVVTVNAPTGCAFINVDEAGENAITVASGANRLLAAEAAVAKGGVLVLQMETPVAESIKVAEAARAFGALVIVNLAPVPERLDVDTMAALMAITDLLVVNEHEAMQAARALGCGSADAASAALAIAQLTGRIVVATLGPAGAFAALADGSVAQAAAPAITPVDTTGAGDTFVGVLASALAEGLDLQSAMSRACKAASLACLGPGAQDAMPRRAVILA
jgi:ribokinase